MNVKAEIECLTCREETIPENADFLKTHILCRTVSSFLLFFTY